MLNSRRFQAVFRSVFSEVTSTFARSMSSHIDASKLVIHRTTSPKQKTPYEQLLFGATFSDHMLEIDWDEKTGWANPVIKPYGNLSLSPAASCFHYGIECFEGMKAYKDKNGKMLMFRPDCNMERLNNSMKRLCLPGIDSAQLIECIKQLLKLDESWVPEKDGYSMYIRPTAIGLAKSLGVARSTSCKLYVILSPVGPYYKSGFKPIRLLANTKDVRAWPGGVGNSKLGGNYGPTILPATNANAQGCEQVLWLFGEDHQITEVGAMNIFFVLKKADGGKELVTAPLTRGDILPGVTRRSILELARNWEKKDPSLSVSERWLTMREIAAAGKDGRLLEAFGAGTAVVIAPVKGIMYDGVEIKVPTGDEIGPVAKKMWTAVTDIQYGRVPHPTWAVPV